MQLLPPVLANCGGSGRPSVQIDRIGRQSHLYLARLGFDKYGQREHRTEHDAPQDSKQYYESDQARHGNSTYWPFSGNRRGISTPFAACRANKASA
jgi:hypothetical protein